MLHSPTPPSTVRQSGPRPGLTLAQSVLHSLPSTVTHLGEGFGEGFGVPGEGPGEGLVVGGFLLGEPG